MNKNTSEIQPESDDQNAMQPGYLGNTPPPGSPPRRGERLWVDRPEQLIVAVNTLKQAQVVAVDAEFTQVRGYGRGSNQSPSHRLALLQLAIDAHCFVVDAWRLNDLSPLAAVVGNPDILILLHGAGADLQVMAERSLSVAHYCDLEAASRSIFGPRESSLAAMLQRALAIRLDKSLQRTDWTRRPLPPAMIAYAARDAEMTLALYSWLHTHYQWALQLHEYTSQEEEPIAEWMKPFLHAPSSAAMDGQAALAEAKAQGFLGDQEQVYADCRAALALLKHPAQRNRLFRLIGDLSLKQLAPEIEGFLQAPSADERAAGIRLLGRLNSANARELIHPLLQDPVQDVRKAAQTTLRNSGNTSPRTPLAPSTHLADGARSWTVSGTNDASSAEEQGDWKARLRSMLGE